MDDHARHSHLILHVKRCQEHQSPLWERRKDIETELQSLELKISTYDLEVEEAEKEIAELQSKLIMQKEPPDA